MFLKNKFIMINQEISKIIKLRQSVFPRHFNGKIIDNDIVLELLNNANTAPSHRMTQPWFFKVFSGKSKEKLINSIRSAIDLPDEKESAEPVVEEKLVPEEQMLSKIQESYQTGFDEGKAATESDLANKFLKLDKLIEGFTSFKENLVGFHSPLVKLSLALANQLVRAELRLDGTAIEELVRQSLAAIESSTESSIVVYLAEEDFEHSDNILGETYPNVKFEIDHDLSSGSLRVVMDDTSIEDLIEILCENPKIRAIGVHIEGIKDIRELHNVALKAIKRKLQKI